MRQFAIPLAFLVACKGPPPPPPLVTLAPARDTVIVPWTTITGAAAIDRDHWLVIAPNEHLVGLVDYTTHGTDVFGGSKHPDYQEPFSLFRAGDSIYLADWGLRRMTVWGPDGRMARAFPVPAALNGVLPTARDLGGSFYSALSPAPGRDGSGNRDSASIVRTPADFSRVDTLAHLAPLDVVQIMSDLGQRYEPRALSGRDAWGALPDGTVWIARVNQNRVDRLPAGATKWNRGVSLRDRVLLVEQEDRDFFLKQFPDELRSNAQKVPFAITKPPFDAAFADDQGRVWLVKSWAMTDTTRAVQVVGPDGRLAAQYQIPRWGRFLAAAGGSILVAESFEDGYRLLRFDLPSGVPVASGEHDETD